ncbi:MAG: hypothetical protein ISS36_03855 [Candidatus Aenigmarchaeota archaeon]|nr:hypothetical protein [Candidatus Aenigmarchaeota archaeon]
MPGFEGDGHYECVVVPDVEGAFEVGELYYAFEEGSAVMVYDDAHGDIEFTEEEFERCFEVDELDDDAPEGDPALVDK